MRITVLTGGSTPEREVAFAGASQVVAALRGAREGDLALGRRSARQDRDPHQGR